MSDCSNCLFLRNKIVFCSIYCNPVDPSVKRTIFSKDSNDLNDLMNASCTMSSAICRSLTNLMAVEINLDWYFKTKRSKPDNLLTLLSSQAEGLFVY